MSLFQAGDFISHAGHKLHWKIECDALTDADIQCLALMARQILPAFGHVEGIPRGGLRFAEALQPFTVAGERRILIVDDVLTSGKSFIDHKAQVATRHPEREIIGCVIFDRNELITPKWVASIFKLHMGIAPWPA